ncbi:MAG: FixH family protein [Nitrospirae bacterium]|nr:FixH family protein [Nitrospirota bacterium]
MKTLIIIVSIIGVAAVAGSIVVGVKSFDGIVTEHPYEKGLAWDEIRNKEKELGWSVDIENTEFVMGDNEVSISVLDKSGRRLTGSLINVMICRQATTAYDKRFDPIKVEEGTFRAKVNFPLYGYWDMAMDVSSGGETLLFKKRVFVDKKDIDVVFDINPKPVYPMNELVFSVTVTENGSPVTDASVNVDLTMPGMFMGINRPVLKHIKDGRYEGQGILPKCPHGGKKWMAEVTITRHNRTSSVSYPFEVE